jgi:DNA-3-methyladenine glycosylase II
MALRPGKARLIRSHADLAEGLDSLSRSDPGLRPVIDAIGMPPLRRRPGGFAGLAAIVVSQQVSVASANAIWRRCKATFRPLQATAVLAAQDCDFAAAGLSRPKARTLRAVAEAVAAERLVFSRLGRLAAEDAHAELTAVKGIGPWTADIYLMFCLGHADAFAAGDLALQESARLAFGLDRRPSAAELLARAESWRPWRGVAARLLWAYYRVAKSREGVR